MGKWLKRVLIAWFVLTLALIPLIYLGGHWAVGHYLGRDIQIGAGSMRLVHPRWRYSLDLEADSLIYTAPGMSARGGATEVTANLFRSLWRFSPSVDFTLDTLRLVLHPDSASRQRTARPVRDSLPFPDFKLPLSVHLEVGRIRVENESGFLAEADGITAATGGPRSASLEVRRLGARALRGLEAGLKANLDWRGDSVQARLEIARAGDRLSAEVRGPKRNLLRAEAEGEARMASSAPYARAFDAPASAPLVRDLSLSLQAAQGAGYRIRAHLAADVSGFDPRAAYRIGPQKAEGSLDFRDSTGTWALRSHGPRGEDVALEGGLRAMARDSLANAAWLARHLEGSLRGHVRNVHLAAAGKILPADVRLRAPRLGAEALDAEIATGDGSRLTADLRKGTAGWTGPFALSIVPEERWVRAFADTNVRFLSLRAKGRAEGRDDGQRIGLEAVVTGLRAFGAEADSIHVAGRYGPAGIELSPSFWHRKGVVWRMNGRMSTGSGGRMSTGNAGRAAGGSNGRTAEFTLSHPDFGSAQASLRVDHIEARLRNLAIYALPYRGLDSLAPRKPKVSASFAWDTIARAGRAEARVTGVYRSEPLEARLRSEWDRRSLRVTELDASLGGNAVRGGGEVALRGRQFHQLASVRREDIRHVFLEADRFDLAKALRIATTQPPLLSGTLDGRLDYSDSAGFRGAYHIRDVRPAAADGALKAREIALLGNGDSLVIRAITQSDKEPLLADSLELGLGGVLRPEQALTLKVVAGRKLLLDLSGRMRAYADFRGNVALRGDASLPGKSGEILGLDARGPLSAVFREGLPGLRMDLDTLRGRYVVPGLDTQSFSAPVRIAGGRLSAPDLSVQGKSGSLGGSAEMDLRKSRALTAHLQGAGLLAQLGAGDKVRLKDLRVDLRSDTSRLELQARIGSGSIEHVKSPLRAAADFSGLSLVYRAPKAVPANGVYTQGDFAFLQARARLDSSDVKYRLRSFETLQNLFKRKPEARGARPGRPIEMSLDLETAGSGNRVETDVLRFAYVGNFSMHGTYPYALVQGRINSTQGQLGTKAQAYDLSRMEIKWLNSTLEEGKLDLEARKKLARDCEAGTTDSCTVINRLAGPLSQAEFTYDTDCGGAYGAGADVAALVYSVRRGCYSSAFAGGGSGLSYQEQALALLEPLASDYLSRAARKLSGHWIAQTKVSGLGSLAPDQGSGADTTTEALALEVISKEFWRTRLSLRSYYRPQETENNDPWAYRMALEWRPPLARYVRDPQWKRRLKNNVSLDASVYTDTAGTMDANQERIGQRLGLNYNYRFWVRRWSKPGTMRELLEEQAADTNAVRAPLRPPSASKRDSASGPNGPAAWAPKEIPWKTMARAAAKDSG